MFRFTRYFLFIFIVTTVIPLISLFVWTNHQMKMMENKNAQHLAEIGVRHLNSSIEQYLKISECSILEKIQNTNLSKLSESELKKTFKDYKLEFIYDQNINKINSGYEKIETNPNGREEIFSVFTIPVKNSRIKALKVSQKVYFNELNLKGPFLVEVYLGNTIDNNSFITTVKEKSAPKPSELKNPFMKYFFGMPAEKFIEERGIPKDKRIKFEIVKLSNNQGKTVATLLIKTGGRFSYLEPPRVLENALGLLIIFAGSALSLIIASYVNKNFINPLEELSEASKEVQKGNLALQLATKVKHKQIINTFDNFNEMVKGLKEKEELRNSFITSLTHDLRTPLIAQERSLSLISNRFKEAGQIDEYELSKNIEKNSKHLLRMVNLILESYQFDAQKQNLTYSSINLKELIDECYEKIKQLIIDKNICFINSLPADLPLLKADKIAMERVFINLISNAVENISEKDKIEVKAEIFEKSIKIAVEDNGPGISPEELNHIFDRYYTGKSLDRKIGSGLGLDVCKKLIDMHNGEITAESEPDKYTRFVVKFTT